MSHPPYVIDEMISAKSIAARIESLASEIETTFAGTDKLVVVGLLRGSFVFIADLVREFPNAEILVTGVEDPDTRAHSPNESQHLGVFKRAILSEALLLARLNEKTLDQLSE